MEVASVDSCNFWPDPLPSAHGVRFDAIELAANRRAPQAGPWYDVFEISEQRIVLSIGDIGARAHDSMQYKRQLRELFTSGRGAEHPLTLLAEAELLLRGENDSAACGMIVGIIDAAVQNFTYVASAGTSPHVRYGDGRVAELPAGTVENPHEGETPPALTVVDLRGASMLMVYSKALLQPTNDFGAGSERLRQLLADDRLAHCDKPATWLARRILGDRVHDDVALLTATFSFTPPAALPGSELPRWSVSWSFEATAAAANAARRTFLGCLQSKASHGLPIDLSAAELIFGELLSNVVRHAPGRVEIILDAMSDVPVLHVMDRGPGYRSRGGRERLPIDELSESGRGLFLINACATRLRVHNRKGQGTHIIATLPLR